jgi:hypothetical protein
MGIRMILSPSDSQANKNRWKIVRLDNYTDVPGEIVTANEDTGEFSVCVKGETRTTCLGPGAIRIIPRGRRG